MSNSTRQRAKQQPAKPHPDLWLHPSGRWCKKIRGRAYYFGKATDPPAEVADRYLTVRDDLLAGRTPRAVRDSLTLRELANRFLSAKRALVDTGELVLRSWADYHRACGRVVAVFGKTRPVADLTAEDFGRLRAALSKTLGPVSLGNEIQRIRVLFKWGYDEGLIDKPIRYGQSFQKPSRKTIRKARTNNGPRMFEADEIRALIDKAGPQLKAMILLGINCGFGNSDVATLPQKALDLDGGWIDYPRPKTGVARRCPLWSETVQALREAIASRPAAQNKADRDLVFITAWGQPWADEAATNNPISKAVTKLLRRLKIHREGVSFYGLRRSFLTIAEETGDFVAVGHVMGHADASMASHYRERISDDRLLAVVNHVRSWLFGSEDQE